MISEAAQIALEDMEAGRGRTVARSVARELIDAGFVRDFFGSLEITEAGRMKARRGVIHRHELNDPNIADLMPPLPPEDTGFTVHSEAEVAAKIDIVERVLKEADMLRDFYVDPHDRANLLREAANEIVRLRNQDLAWDRARAQRAAGAANARTNVWTESQWMVAFMDAYEQDGGV